MKTRIELIKGLRELTEGKLSLREAREIAKHIVKVCPEILGPTSKYSVGQKLGDGFLISSVNYDEVRRLFVFTVRDKNGAYLLCTESMLERVI